MFRYSIVIPSYNYGSFLSCILESLNHQAGFGKGDFEVIVVDDGSQENLYRIVKEANYNFDIQYLYLERTEGSCAARARNYGWRIAKGEIIIFLDHDVIVREHYLQEVDRYFAMSNNILLFGTRLMLQHEVTLENIRNGNVFRENYFSGQKPELHEFRYRLFNLFSYNFSSFIYPWLLVFGCNMIVPNVWLTKVGGFDETSKGWGLDDVELAYRLYEAGLTLVLNTKLEVLHQFHGDGTDVIPDERYDHVDRKTAQFMKKHPHAFSLPEGMGFCIFKGWVELEWNGPRMEPVKTEIIEFRDKGQNQTLQRRILSLSQEPGYEIIVKDFVEDTDIDVWIQLMGRTKSIIKYFPMSKTYEINP
ncbi:MAG TPA: glycosyltransferase family 2 protein [Bacillota bacterium]|nr:glycosyltransferase family 2 protein [Bacillota bacterium]